MIDEQVLLRAVEMHGEGISLGIEHYLHSLGVDSDEFRNAALAMTAFRFGADHAPPRNNESAYGGGLIDGFMLGVVAARLEESQ